MKVFISWSGERSRETADVLCTWIRQVIQSAETWISLDIEKGVRWNDKVNKELEETKVGIICLNKENLSSEWILFEAGALSKTSDAHVCTFLLNINPTDIKPPLGQFQHTLFSKEDIRRLMHTINNKIIAQKEKTLSEKDLDEIFDERWYKLEEKLNEIKSQDQIIKEPTRTDRELLEEILQTVRGQNKEFNKYQFYSSLGESYPNPNKDYAVFMPFPYDKYKDKTSSKDSHYYHFDTFRKATEKMNDDKKDENEVGIIRLEY